MTIKRKEGTDQKELWVEQSKRDGLLLSLKVVILHFYTFIISGYFNILHFYYKWLFYIHFLIDF